MIKVTEKDSKKIALLRKWKGSLDCQYSASFSKVTAHNLGVLCQYSYAAQNKANEWVVGSLQQGLRKVEIESSFPVIFRPFSDEDPIQNFTWFEHTEAKGIVDMQGYSFQDQENRNGNRFAEVTQR